MPHFSETSKRRLKTCDCHLQILFNKIIEVEDCAILCGHRGMEEQNKAHAGGFSQLLFPHSKHNRMPSKAVDVLPYPVDYNDIKRIFHFAGYVKATADILGIKVIWGGDWKFFDPGHWEIPIL